MFSKLIFSFLLLTIYYGSVRALKLVDLKGNRVIPVVTPFDEFGNLNLKAIPPYMDYLIKCNQTTVWLFGLNAEPFSLNLSERKRILDIWLESKYRKNFVFLVGAGFMTFNDSCNFAKYCESKKVDAIIYKTQTDAGPSTAAQAASDVGLIAQCASSTPIFIFTNVNFECCRDINYGEVVRLCIKNVPNFAGYVGDLFKAEQSRAYNTKTVSADYGCREQYILNFYYSASTAKYLDFTAHSTPYANIYPQLVNQIDNARSKEAAFRVQSQLDMYGSKLCYLRPNCRIICALNIIKAAVSLVTGIDMGNTRRPLCSITDADLDEVKNILISQGQSLPAKTQQAQATQEKSAERITAIRG